MAEITNTLLSSPETDIKLKISMLKTMIKNVKAMTGFTASSLRVKSVQEHNDEVRSNLSLRFQTMKKNSPEQLEKL
ncbi:MAG: hypothetical protein LBO09_00415 [Candidatus Peribacteria bacterium]|jgi:hypothetical protein|nr:hypothetical protein [Candidatus Peribacteria bacterium]